MSAITIETPSQFTKMQEELIDTIEQYTAEKAKAGIDQQESVVKNLTDLMAMIAKALWESMTDDQKIECSTMSTFGEVSLLQAISTVPSH